LDPVVESVRRQVVCTGVWHVGSFGACGRKFAFLAALVGRETDFSHVSKSVCDVLDKDARGRRRTRVFGLDAQFNGVRSDEVCPAQGASVIRTIESGPRSVQITHEADEFAMRMLAVNGQMVRDEAIDSQLIPYPSSYGDPNLQR
jgi:hypothetical protein